MRRLLSRIAARATTTAGGAGAAPLRRHGTAALPCLLVIVLYFLTVALIPGFGSRISVLSILVIGSLLGLASVGQTLAVMIGGVDLSIPALMGLGDVLSVYLLGHGWNFWVVVLTIVATAAVVGALNAGLSRAMRVHPLIVTLATGSIVAGVVLTGTKGIAGNGQLPGWMTDAVSPVAHTWVIPLPGVLVAWIVVSAFLIWLQRGMRFGRLLYAVGSNPVAARLSRSPESAVWVISFVISAVVAALTGILLAAYSGAASVDIANPYLFTTIAAVVVGGTSLLGGSGGYGRTVLGVLVVTELTTLLLGLGYSPYVQELILGILMVCLVSIYGRDEHVSRRI